LSTLRSGCLVLSAFATLCRGLQVLLQLTGRENDVLIELAKGQSNKVIAKVLDLSPKTVGTHIENLYRKLQVSSRGAAVLKAMDLG